MLKLKQEISDTMIAAISRIIANSSDPEPRLMRLFDLVEIKYTTMPLADRLRGCVTLEEVNDELWMENGELASKVRFLLSGHNAMEKIKKAL